MPSRIILAIDYGRRRMGLALSDEMGLTARPLATWARTNRRRDLSRLRELCREQSVGMIVVGWPLHLDGTESEMAKEAGRFAERVRKNLGLPVELADERLSSWAAQETLTEIAPSSRAAARRRKTALDQVAAAVILRDYLSRAPNPAQNTAQGVPRG
jgi:putative pre-16S rRNA nuclease